VNLGPRLAGPAKYARYGGLKRRMAAHELWHWEVEHPAAKVLVELAHLQDTEVGDGTTSVVA